MTSDYKMTINGRPVSGADGKFEVFNPATGQAFDAAPECSQAQLDEAVAAARAAYPGWRATPIDERADLLRKAADALLSVADDMS